MVRLLTELAIWTVQLDNWSVESVGAGGRARTIDRHSRSNNDSNITTCVIEAIGLTRLFGATKAVAGLDLTVPTGVIYGLLVPNGAGKTTTIRILARTPLRPDDGVARAFGHDVVRDGQFASIDPELTGQENLVLLGRLLGLARGRAGEVHGKRHRRGLRAGARAGG